MEKSKQDTLLLLMKNLHLPLTPEEAREYVGKLSDEEVGLLVKKCEAVKTYQDEVEIAAKRENPDKYEKLRKAHEDEVMKLEENHSREMQSIQEKEDGELDQIEEKANKDLGGVTEQYQGDVRGLVKASDEIVSGINSVLGKN